MKLPITLVFSENELVNINSICSGCNIVVHKIQKRFLQGNVFFNRLNAVVEEYENIKTNYYYEIENIDSKKEFALKIALDKAVILKVKNTEDEILADKLFETYCLKEFSADGLDTATDMMETMIEEIGEYIDEKTKTEIHDYIDEVNGLKNKLGKFEKTISNIYEGKLKI